MLPYVLDLLSCYGPNRYLKAVQSTTLEKVPSLILGFFGFTSSACSLDSKQMGMATYKDPKNITRFVSYLKARGVGIGQINKHISLARKVRNQSNDNRCCASTLVITS
jgi:hypothetical protein